mmetsp:Transcript_59642/g.153612  ORF Transcript_59642/g.153612 Transcript_59642/m.153612 type:complete len:207 (+) Transcript_59642:575-1195(+)
MHQVDRLAQRVRRLAELLDRGAQLGHVHLRHLRARALVLALQLAHPDALALPVVELLARGLLLGLQPRRLLLLLLLGEEVGDELAVLAAIVLGAGSGAVALIRRSRLLVAVVVVLVAVAEDDGRGGGGGRGLVARDDLRLHLRRTAARGARPLRAAVHALLLLLLLLLLRQGLLLQLLSFSPRPLVVAGSALSVLRQRLRQLRLLH